LSFSRSIPSSPGDFFHFRPRHRLRGRRMARVESVSLQRPECFAFALLRAPKPCALLPYSAQGCQESCREKRAETMVSRLAGWKVTRSDYAQTGIGRAKPYEWKPPSWESAPCRLKVCRMTFGRARFGRHRANAIRWGADSICLKISFCRRRGWRPGRRGWSFSWRRCGTSTKRFRGGRPGCRCVKPYRGPRGWS
jgi:hypothetical protein